MDVSHSVKGVDEEKARLLELWELMTEDQRENLLAIGAALSRK
jgi:hypothetical protein